MRIRRCDSPFPALELTRPAFARTVTLLGAAVAFIAAQAFYYALGHKICTGTNRKMDSAWIATLLETVSIGLIYAAWQFVTEDDWVRFVLAASVGFCACRCWR